MIVSQLQIYNFRRFKSIDGKPGHCYQFIVKLWLFALHLGGYIIK